MNKAIGIILAGLLVLGGCGTATTAGEAGATPSPTKTVEKTAHEKFNEVYAERGSKDGDKQIIELTVIGGCKQLEAGDSLDSTLGTYVALATPGADQKGGVLDPELYVYCPEKQDEIRDYLKKALKEG